MHVHCLDNVSRAELDLQRCNGSKESFFVDNWAFGRYKITSMTLDQVVWGLQIWLSFVPCSVSLPQHPQNTTETRAFHVWTHKKYEDRGRNENMHKDYPSKD